ncbi:MAG: N-acetylmuramoyl-L-alanine amidase family protein [Flavobacterium sp.]
MKKFLVIVTIVLSFLSTAQDRKFKLVLDAGHGGKDPGAQKNGCIEKEIALDVVLQVGQILEKYPDFNIKYTRKTDVFIPLKDRAKMANDFEANLFVSVHCNSSTSPNPSGSMTLVMGLSRSNMNFEIAKTENAVIFQEDNYKKDYKGFDPNNPSTQIGLKILQEETLLQSIAFASEVQNQFKNTLQRKDLGMHQQPLWVLDATVMPGVLIELGFLSNAKESKYINSKEGRHNFAQVIALAILKYKNQLFETDTPLFEPKIVIPIIVEEPKPELVTIKDDPNYNLVVDTTKVNTEKKFKVQISYSTKKLELIPSNFRGLSNITVTEEANGYKYYYGAGSTKEACKKLVAEAKAKGYTSAFIVEDK